jgi:hypothetical protein
MKKNLLASALFSVMLGSCDFNSKSTELEQSNFEKILNSFLIDDAEKETVEEEVIEIDYTRYDEKTNAYFKEITLQNEFNDNEKETPDRWTEDMNIYVYGLKKEYMMDELQKIVGELNDLIHSIRINIVTKKSDANFIIFLGSMNDFKEDFPDIKRKDLEKNWGLFSTHTNNGKMYVDMFRTHDDIDAQKHLLREELTQSLGFYNDSWKYPNSIFYQGWTTITEYAPIDLRLLDLLYN